MHTELFLCGAEGCVRSLSTDSMLENPRLGAGNVKLCLRLTVGIAILLGKQEKHEGEMTQTKHGEVCACWCVSDVVDLEVSE